MELFVAVFLLVVVTACLVAAWRSDRSGALDQPSTPGIMRSGLERDHSR